MDNTLNPKNETLLFDYMSQFVELTEQEKETIQSLSLFHAYKKGKILLSEGQLSNKGYFVLKGCIRSYYIIDGDEKTTAFYTEMEGVTPNCVTDKQPSEYYISCLEDSILLITTPELEQQVFKKFPRFESICRIMSEQLVSKKQIDSDQFKIYTPEQRYKNLLENRPDLIRRIPQHQIASFLGITPPSLSRIKARIVQLDG